jgi:hypothetical protein
MNNAWLKNLARVNLPVYQFESDRLKIAYAGYSAKKKNFFVRLSLGGSQRQAFCGRRWFWEIPDIINSFNFDLVFSEASQITLKRFQRCRGYVIPVWAPMRIDIDRPFREIRKQRVSHFSGIERLIRKYALTYKIRRDNESFKNFYHNMYKPYINKRYGDEAFIRDWNELWKSSSSLFLIEIKENEVLSSAMLVRKSENFLHLICLGLVDGKEEYLRHGAIGASYYFALLEGQKMGCRYLDVGATRPFLTEGLTRFKMGLGAEFVSDYSPKKEYIWLGVNERSFRAQEFIKNNPFMYLDKDFRLIRSGT